METIAHKRQKIEAEPGGETVEILVNRCFGGFGLSRLALEKMNKRMRKWRQFMIMIRECVPDSLIGEEVLPLDLFKLILNLQHDERTDPVAIQIVKEMGEKANGLFSRIEIAEFPRKYENYYTVSDYDGKETIYVAKREYQLNLIKTIIIDQSTSSDEKIDEIRRLF